MGKGCLPINVLLEANALGSVRETNHEDDCYLLKMLVKAKDRGGAGRWRRRRSEGRGEPARPGGAAQIQAVGTSRERRHGGPSEDRALYTCECGYAFQAPVTTSVGCPHCTRTQAW
jgi:hypothetical protein